MVAARIGRARLIDNSLLQLPVLVSPTHTRRSCTRIEMADPHYLDARHG